MTDRSRPASHPGRTKNERISLSARQWDAFVSLLDRPAVEKPKLRRLLTEPSVLQPDRVGGSHMKGDSLT